MYDYKFTNLARVLPSDGVSDPSRGLGLGLSDNVFTGSHGHGVHATSSADVLIYSVTTVTSESQAATQRNLPSPTPTYYSRFGCHRSVYH